MYTEKNATPTAKGYSGNLMTRFLRFKLMTAIIFLVSKKPIYFKSVKGFVGDAGV